MKINPWLALGMSGLLLATSPASAWGPDGHRMVARLAAKALPADMPQFVLREAERLMFLSYEPDFWRDSKEEAISPALRRGHDPDHHFHLELFSAPELPPDRYIFIKALNRDGEDPSAVGVLPYRAMELFQRMRVGFRQWRSTKDRSVASFLEARIIDDAGILAHYVADAAEPLHVTTNHNGWASQENPRNYTRDTTLHIRFEDEFVHARIRDTEVAPRMSKVQKVIDGLACIRAEIQRSHDRVVPLYELEKETRFDAANGNPKSIAFVEERLADGAAALRDLWYAAYRSSREGE